MNPESETRKDIRTHKANMEHRHFATIATIIREMPLGTLPREDIASHFADELTETNPRFDRVRFLKACGV